MIKGFFAISLLFLHKAVNQKVIERESQERSVEYYTLSWREKIGPCKMTQMDSV